MQLRPESGQGSPQGLGLGLLFLSHLSQLLSSHLPESLYPLPQIGAKRLPRLLSFVGHRLPSLRIGAQQMLHSRSQVSPESLQLLPADFQLSSSFLLQASQTLCHRLGPLSRRFRTGAFVQGSPHSPLLPQFLQLAAGLLRLVPYCFLSLLAALPQLNHQGLVLL
jgi:hypothetical protein